MLIERGESIRKIAKSLGRSPSTSSRELRHNACTDGYYSEQAQRMAEARRSKASSVPRKVTDELWARVLAGIGRYGWSPGSDGA